MNEYETQIQYLIGLGTDRHDAELRLRDDDLWVLDPSSRMGRELEGEEGVRQRQEDTEFMSEVADMVVNLSIIKNAALWQLVVDARARAWEALARAEQPLEG